MDSCAKIANENAQINAEPSRRSAAAICAAIVSLNGLHRSQDFLCELVDGWLEVFIQQSVFGVLDHLILLLAEN